MRITELGQGPAVLFIHGTPSPSTDFLPVARALETTHRSLIVDLPGYRGEPALTGPEAFARTEAMLEDELLARGISEVAVVGFSGGALRAFSLAFSKRVRVTALVSVGGHAGLDEKDLAGFEATAAGVRARQIPGAALPGLFVSPAYLAAHPEVAADVAGWLDLSPADELADELLALTTEAPDLRPRLRELNVPALAIAGELDLALPPAYSHQLGELVPGLEVEIVEGAGHALLIETPERVVDAIRRTLSR